MAGRPHALADPEVAKAVAQAFVDGNSRKTMAELFGVKDLDTITRWRRDPRVKNYALKLVEDRVLEITRKVDSTIAQRLEDTSKMTVRELLDVRKEFLGGGLRSQTEKADEVTTTAAMEELENNPELAEQLEELLSAKPEAAAKE